MQATTTIVFGPLSTYSLRLRRDDIERNRILADCIYGS